MKLFNFINKNKKSNLIFHKELVCYNQTQLYEFFTYANHLHKNLKKDYYSSKSDEEKYKKSKHRLVDFLNEKLNSVCEYNFSRVKEFYFKNRKNVFINTFLLRKDEKLISNSKFSNSIYCVSKKYIENNTAFKNVMNTGRVFIENNVPFAALKDVYHNPLLSNERVKEYRINLLDFLRNSKDKRWMACWNFENGNKEVKSFFKSTMIIPMTILTSLLKPEFSDYIGVEEEERIIFGFICFDSEKIGFFQDDDINIGYILADFISLYISIRLKFTIESDAFMDKEKKFIKISPQ